MLKNKFEKYDLLCYIINGFLKMLYKLKQLKQSIFITQKLQNVLMFHND